MCTGLTTGAAIDRSKGRAEGRTEMRTNSVSPEDYPVVVHRRGRRFVMEAPALAVIAEGDDLCETEASLRTRIGDVLRSYETAALPPPAPERIGDSATAMLGHPTAHRLFGRSTLIAGIMLLLVAIAGAYGTASVIGAVRSTVETNMAVARDAVRTALSPRAASETLVSTVDLLRQITPQRRALLIQQLGSLADELEPYLAPLQPLFPGNTGSDAIIEPTPSSAPADNGTADPATLPLAD